VDGSFAVTQPDPNEDMEVFHEMITDFTLMILTQTQDTATATATNSLRPSPYH
jgi:hypothetical protein